MSTAHRKTDLSPLEALVVEHTLGDARANAQSPVLARIQLLTRERQSLYAHSSAHPFSAPRNALRIREINTEIEHLWESLRRERAQRRVQIERALNVIAEDVPEDSLEDAWDDEPVTRSAKAAKGTTPASKTADKTTDKNASKNTDKTASKAATPKRASARKVAKVTRAPEATATPAAKAPAVRTRKTSLGTTSEATVAVVLREDIAVPSARTSPRLRKAAKAVKTVPHTESPAQAEAVGVA